MIKELPLPIQAYVSALNQHDIDAMLLPFSKKATVLDEGQTYDGHVDIRRWMEETTRKYRVTGEVSGVAGADAPPRVSMLIAGNFPSSPITLPIALHSKVVLYPVWRSQYDLRPLIQNRPD